jgi:hypothetical protein
MADSVYPLKDIPDKVRIRLAGTGEEGSEAAVTSPCEKYAPCLPVGIGGSWLFFADTCLGPQEKAIVAVYDAHQHHILEEKERCGPKSSKYLGTWDHKSPFCLGLNNAGVPVQFLLQFPLNYVMPPDTTWYLMSDGTIQHMMHTCKGMTPGRRVLGHKKGSKRIILVEVINGMTNPAEVMLKFDDILALLPKTIGAPMQDQMNNEIGQIKLETEKAKAEVEKAKAEAEVEKAKAEAEKAKAEAQAEKNKAAATAVAPAAYAEAAPTRSSTQATEAQNASFFDTLLGR